MNRLQQGLTLIELMVTLAILSIVGIAVGVGYSQLSGGINTAQDRAVAESEFVEFKTLIESDFRVRAPVNEPKQDICLLQIDSAEQWQSSCDSSHPFTREAEGVILCHGNPENQLYQVAYYRDGNSLCRFRTPVEECSYSTTALADDDCSNKISASLRKLAFTQLPEEVTRVQIDYAERGGNTNRHSFDIYPNGPIKERLAVKFESESASIVPNGSSSVVLSLSKPAEGGEQIQLNTDQLTCTPANCIVTLERGATQATVTLSAGSELESGDSELVSLRPNTEIDIDEPAAITMNVSSGASDSLTLGWSSSKSELFANGEDATITATLSNRPNTAVSTTATLTGLDCSATPAELLISGISYSCSDSDAEVTLSFPINQRTISFTLSPMRFSEQGTLTTSASDNNTITQEKELVLKTQLAADKHRVSLSRPSSNSLYLPTVSGASVSTELNITVTPAYENPVELDISTNSSLTCGTDYQLLDAGEVLDCSDDITMAKHQSQKDIVVKFLNNSALAVGDYPLELGLSGNDDFVSQASSSITLNTTNQSTFSFISSGATLSRNEENRVYFLLDPPPINNSTYTVGIAPNILIASASVSSITASASAASSSAYVAIPANTLTGSSYTLSVSESNNSDLNIGENDQFNITVE